MFYEIDAVKSVVTASKETENIDVTKSDDDEERLGIIIK
jgi:hypothetical protein